MRLPGNFAGSLAVAAVVLFTSSTHNAEAAKLSGRSVKIGCMVPLTGKGAEWGQTAKLSREIAVEENNAKGDIGVTRCLQAPGRASARYSIPSRRSSIRG